MSSATFHGRLKKKGGKLEISRKVTYEKFTESLKEGDEVDLYMEVVGTDGTLPQLAKIHVLLREMALTTGHTVSDLKLIVKDRAGLCLAREISGKEFLICKSLGDCSKEELDLVIKVTTQLCDELGILH